MVCVVPFHYAPPPLEDGGAYCFEHVGRSECWYVGLPNILQLITQELFAPEASKLVGR